MADETPNKLIDATISTLAEDGMGGATARAIGARAGVNPALIYYHFDSLAGLLAEASRAVTTRRAAVYRQRLAQVDTLAELAQAARDLHEEERASGNLAMLSQLLAGSRTHPELAPALNENFELLATEVAAAIGRILVHGPLHGYLDTHQLARAVSAGFIGIELLDSVSGDEDPALFDTLDTMTALIDLVLSAGAIPTALLRRRLRTIKGP